MISGFTFVHNALVAGYPIIEAITAVLPYVDEVVAVDMESTDDTVRVLDAMGCRVISARWIPGGGNHGCLAPAYALNEKCYGDVVLHFEADEVYSEQLLECIAERVRNNVKDIVVHRIQVEQNFQRVRWYPQKVHRVFPPGTTEQIEHRTTRQEEVHCVLSPDCGLLWDCSSTCRDNLIARVQQQGELWGESSRTVLAPEHIVEPHYESITEEYLKQPHWTWTTSPLNIPGVLRPLVGQTRYYP
jgi:hypothetical protein